jgi:3-hydroxyacyl-[acyl-carrier-protein] dehydratase
LNNELNQLDIQDILQLLPHRYPFLMVDRVVHYEMSEERKVLRAIKNVSFNEPFFQGHFPEKPVFPGVLILEAMAQATGIPPFRIMLIKSSINKEPPQRLFVLVD